MCFRMCEAVHTSLLAGKGGITTLGDAEPLAVQISLGSKEASWCLPEQQGSFAFYPVAL